MADLPGQAALLRLMAWLSPAFPVGSFSYSHGLEMAAQDGLVTDAVSLREWLADLIARGSAWNDAVLFAEAHRLVSTCDSAASRQITPPTALRAAPSPSRGGSRAMFSPLLPLDGVGVAEGDGGGESCADAGLADLCDLGEAMAGSRERHMETMLQGAAFLKAAAAWPHPALAILPADCPYPVAVGAVAGAHGVPLESALAAFLQAFASNQIQAAIRLSVVGQIDAIATLAALEPLIGETAARAAVSTLDDLGSATIVAEIAAMKHETQYSRLFRT